MRKNWREMKLLMTLRRRMLRKLKMGIQKKVTPVITWKLRRKHKNLQYLNIRVSMAGNSVMSLQDPTTSLVLTIGNLSESFQVQCTMNIERGTALRRPPPVSFLYLKDISGQFSGQQAGKRYISCLIKQ